MESLLPEDLAELVYQHGAVMCVQRAWRRYSRVSHARRVDWTTLRAYLIRNGMWRTLVRYPNVRREWRTEPSSWLRTTRAQMRAIAHEAEEDVTSWGVPSWNS